MNLEIFKPGKPIFYELWEHVWGAVREGWDREMAQVEASLEREKDSFANQILPLVTISDLDRHAWKTVKEIKGLRINKISLLRTELPESEYRPPHTAAYHRPDASSVNISARISMDIDATVEIYRFLSLFLGQQGSAEEVETPPKSEDITLHESFNVSRVGTVHQGTIGDFRVIDVHVDK